MITCFRISIFPRLQWLTVLLLVVAQLATAAVPAGYYYPARNKKKAELKTALSALASPVKVLDYGSGEGFTWQGFYYTDQNSDGSVIDMYSNIIRYFNGFNSISGMHIEHSLPKSWWGGAENSAYHDLFHLYPSDGSTNSSKSNHPLGIVKPEDATLDNGVSRIGTSSFSPAYTGKAFEPADEFKGDFARSYLYIATIYEHYAPLWTSPMMQRNTYPVWTPWARQLLLQWHAADPVSVKERLRQEAVFKIQGNRNPFIDYHDLVSYIWGPDTLQSYPFPDVVDAFLSLPRRGDVLDFDVILQGDTLGKPLTIKGQNLSGSLSLRLKRQSAAFALRHTTISAAGVQAGASTRIVFQPPKAGVFRDTLLLEGGGLNEALTIPLMGVASRQMMTLEPENISPVGATLHWIADRSANTYSIDFFASPSKAGNLLISSYVEGSSFNKSVEVYNGTGQTVQLADYALAKQSNGVGNYESVFPLKGELAHGSSVVVIHQQCTNTDLKSKAMLFTDSVMNFNGNDAIALLHNGLRIDAVGYFDVGPGLVWGLDKTFHRKATVTHPTKHFSEDEWNVLPTDNFSPLKNHVMNLNAQETSLYALNIPADSSWYALQNLQALTTYYYRVSSVRSGGAIPSVNSARFTTAAPVAPVPLEPTEISDRHFVAEWEADVYTNQFELETYTKVGAGFITVNEGFDGVGTNAAPLPEGWASSASAIYTTTTSSGTAPPSIQLRNTGEWLQTPVYSNPIVEIGFMYRYPSTGTGNYFTVEVLKNNQWVKVEDIPYANTAKNYLTYTFGSFENVRSLKVTFTKVAGNLAIDDFRIVYGSETNAYLLQNQPVTGVSYRVGNLEPSTNYFFRVRSVIGNARSDWSEVMQVKTAIASALNEHSIVKVRWQTTPSGVKFTQLEPGSRLQLYGLTGVLLGDYPVKETVLEIPLSKDQLFIVRLVSPQQLVAFKIIR